MKIIGGLNRSKVFYLRTLLLALNLLWISSCGLNNSAEIRRYQSSFSNDCHRISKGENKTCFTSSLYKFSFDDLLVMPFGFHGMCYQFPIGRIIIRKSVWKNKTPEKRKDLVYHELSHCSGLRFHSNRKMDVAFKDGSISKNVNLSIMEDDNGTFILADEEWGYLQELFNGSVIQLKRRLPYLVKNKVVSKYEGFKQFYELRRMTLTDVHLRLQQGPATIMYDYEITGNPVNPNPIYRLKKTLINDQQIVEETYENLTVDIDPESLTIESDEFSFVRGKTTLKIQHPDFPWEN